MKKDSKGLPTSEQLQTCNLSSVSID